VAELTPADAPKRYGPLFYVGAAGLLLAMTIEAIAVIGRHIGVPLLGALEIIQVAILIAASASMLTATLADNHASVRLIVGRLSATTQRRLGRFAYLIAAAFFGCLALAAGWLTLESWHDFEESELLHIPYRPLRVVVFVLTTAIALVFVRKALQRASGTDAT
jgi:TRAP-type C4-dicarboxylate transport system permease small subunit